MKKLVLSIVFGIVTFGSVACTNPSMENGFAKLNDALAELEQAIASLNIAQMEVDLAQINTDIAQIVADLETQQNVWDDAIAQIAEIRLSLQELVDDSNNWATTEQLQQLALDVETFGEGIDLLVLKADYDYDGVINALDKCPDTPLDQINNVDSDGCAPEDEPVKD